MKKSISFIAISLIALFLLLQITPAAAQGPTDLTTLTIKLWPEYDDPRLLVIIDGQLATPGSEIRLPIPAEAELNAVATADSTGRLLKNEWSEEKTADGGRLLVMTPENPIFRVEYYTPLSVDGDKRTLKFALPAGYLNAAQALIETLLPPDSQDISLTPPADPSGPSEDEAHIFRRTLEGVEDRAIVQEVTYVNPRGAFTMSESTASTGEAQQPETPPPAETAPPQETKSSLTIWIILLGVVALLLIAGGVVGLWLTRKREPEEPLPAPRSREGKRKTKSLSMQPAAGNLDRFCRQCGEEFGPDDRFCRYCGAPRQSY